MDVVTLTVVGNELEAEELCGLLRANGIECTYRRGDVAQAADIGGGFAIAGPTEVLVRQDDLDAARELLPS